MANDTSKGDHKPSGAQQRPEQQTSQRPDQKDSRRKLDIVDLAGMASFPASDPPSWNP